MTIGVLGGTGPAGKAVALNFAAAGEEVIVGSRSVERAEEALADLKQRYVERGLKLTGGTNADAAKADVVVVATPWEGAILTVKELAGDLEGKLVISMVNALTKWGKQIVPLTVPTGSVTAAVALALPASRVAGAFHHLPAEQWQDLDNPLDADVLVCSDSRAVAREVVAMTDRLPGLRGVDAGSLSHAIGIEAMTATIIGINIRYKTHAAVRLTGLER